MLFRSWEDLAEVKALAVDEDFQKRGIGRKLVEACLKEARRLGAKKVFCLTYVPEFFKRFGFQKISRKKLPHKIWTECLQCHKFPNCDEQAMMLSWGRLSSTDTRAAKTAIKK